MSVGSPSAAAAQRQQSGTGRRPSKEGLEGHGEMAEPDREHHRPKADPGRTADITPVQQHKRRDGGAENTGKARYGCP